MRNYSRIDRYLSELFEDIYPQPPDKVHTRLTKEVIWRFITPLVTCHSVLDVGCGEGFAQPMFERIGIQYEGICLGNDYQQALKKKRNVKLMDFSFMDYEDERFDLLFARHALEHSPFPLITLMEWHRVSRRWLCLVMPKPQYWGYLGRNHYYVLNKKQIINILLRSGWNIVDEHLDEPLEYQFLCEKMPRVGSFYEDKVGHLILNEFNEDHSEDDLDLALSWNDVLTEA